MKGAVAYNLLTITTDNKCEISVTMTSSLYAMVLCDEAVFRQPCRFLHLDYLDR